MNSNEFFINMKPTDIPPYTKGMHFYEQPLSTIQFFEEEMTKIKRGITIGGVWIHPWLYFHLNYFITPIPVFDEVENRIKDKLLRPSLRDNEWFFAEILKEAQDKGRGIFLFGSRRWSKTTIEVSVAQWLNILTPYSTTEIMAGSTDDLNIVARMLKTSFSNIHPAFAIPIAKRRWDSHVILGFKDLRLNADIVWSDIFIKNLAGGKTEESSEKGAGGAPAAVIIEEAGKASFLSAYNSLLPAISTPMGFKCNVLISGTGGNSKLSTDAKKVLSNPEAYKMLPMNWDTLEKNIKDPRDITWSRKVFGIYMPPQMAYEEGVIKKDTNLAEYLRIDNEELAKISIQETDWKTATKIFKQKREDLAKDKESLNKEIMYHPLDSDECFLGGVGNPFPADEARRRKQYLEETGKGGRSVRVFQNEMGKLQEKIDDITPQPEFPFPGGIHNSPILLFDKIPTDAPPADLNVGGLDPYKSKESTTPSLGSLYILKRKDDLQQPLEKIVCSYTARPSTQKVFNQTCLNLLEAWNAECMMENIDGSFLQFLEERNKAYDILAIGVDWSKSINKNSNPKNKFGYYPTASNQNYIFSLAVEYAWEVITVIDEDTGEEVDKLGVEYIDDPMLLQEMIDYKEGGNFDRIVAFGAALAWARWLDKIHRRPAKESVSTEKEQRKILKERERQRTLARMPITLKNRK